MTAHERVGKPRIAQRIMIASRRVVLAACAAAPALLTAAPTADAQGHDRPHAISASAPPGSSRVPVRARDSVVVTANPEFAAGETKRYFMGDTYRDFWTRRITVPVVDLGQFASGLTATEEGGGNQTRSLRFKSPDGREWTFRPLTKDKLNVIEAWEGTPVMSLFRDGLSGSFPAAPVLAPAILDGAGLVHPTPQLVVLPDDEASLGKFRKDFAGRLGTIEEHVSDGDDGPLFGNAVRIIDSDHLIKQMNASPGRHVNAREMLKARLVDIYLGDTDRHRDQWKWGRMHAGDSLFTPIPRDRDQVVATHDGLLLQLARLAKPYLVVFDSTYPKVEKMVGYARDLDDRLLAELQRAVWDSVARELQLAITDSIIHDGVRAMPAEFQPLLVGVEGKLRARRDAIPRAASDYYASLARVVSIHATDSSDTARIERARDGSVRVTLGDAGAPWFSRRFVPRETKEVRIYLHGGDDQSTVVGESGGGITVRVVGGGGTNSFVDSTVRRGGAGSTRAYDVGRGRDEYFDPDSAFNRLPWLLLYGDTLRPATDFGTRLQPTASLSLGRGLGFVPGIGVRRVGYGFRSAPYRSMLAAQVQYSSAVDGFRIALQGDVRPAETRFHFGGEGEVTEFAVIQYGGQGNDLPHFEDEFHEVHQRQWIARPWVGMLLGLNHGVMLGPVVKRVATDRMAQTYLAATQPYGSGDVTQLGVELRITHDSRDNASNPHRGVRAQVTATSYAAAGGVTSPFQRVAAFATTYIPIPVRKEATLALRAGGAKLFGTYPFYEAAFLGGGENLRAMHYQQIAGDASAYGNAELRVPLVRVPLVLPWKIGLLGYGEAGRVSVDGESGGGWHRAVGGGLSIGVLGPAAGISILYTNSRERRWIFGTGVSF